MIFVLKTAPLKSAIHHRVRGILASLIDEVSAGSAVDGAAVYVHSSGEHLQLPVFPPTSFKDFGPTEFTGSAHYILAASLSPMVPECGTALNFSDEAKGLTHALERAALDLKAGREKRALVLGALLAYPVDSDLTAADEVAYAFVIENAAEAESLAGEFAGAEDRRTLRSHLLKFAKARA